ncbi:hypothetical protein HDU93_006159 [Gonapodya sp. JEL0774]|nr:hypothetical protein HDU93_006159 [Gonapodya sp. JEL0774]
MMDSHGLLDFQHGRASPLARPLSYFNPGDMRHVAQSPVPAVGSNPLPPALKVGADKMDRSLGGSGTAMGTGGEEELLLLESQIDSQVFHYLSRDDYSKKQERFRKTVMAADAIVKGKLYKAKAPSLEAYFREVWKISRAQVYRFIDCAQVLEALESFDSQPSHERLCRSLKRLAKTPEDLRTLWTAVLAKTGNNPDGVTSTFVNRVWDALVAKGEVQGSRSAGSDSASSPNPPHGVHEHEEENVDNEIVPNKRQRRATDLSNASPPDLMVHRTMVNPTPAPPPPRPHSMMEIDQPLPVRYHFSSAPLPTLPPQTRATAQRVSRTESGRIFIMDSDSDVDEDNHGVNSTPLSPGSSSGGDDFNRVGGGTPAQELHDVRLGSLSLGLTPAPTVNGSAGPFLPQQGLAPGRDSPRCHLSGQSSSVKQGSHAVTPVKMNVASPYSSHGPTNGDYPLVPGTAPATEPMSLVTSRSATSLGMSQAQYSMQQQPRSTVGSWPGVIHLDPQAPNRRAQSHMQLAPVGSTSPLHSPIPRPRPTSSMGHMRGSNRPKSPLYASGGGTDANNLPALQLRHALRYSPYQSPPMGPGASSMQGVMTNAQLPQTQFHLPSPQISYTRVPSPAVPTHTPSPDLSSGSVGSDGGSGQGRLKLRVGSAESLSTAASLDDLVAAAMIRRPSIANAGPSPITGLGTPGTVRSPDSVLAANSRLSPVSRIRSSSPGTFALPPLTSVVPATTAPASSVEPALWGPGSRIKASPGLGLRNVGVLTTVAETSSSPRDIEDEKVLIHAPAPRRIGLDFLLN